MLNMKNLDTEDTEKIQMKNANRNKTVLCQLLIFLKKGCYPLCALDVKSETSLMTPFQFPVLFLLSKHTSIIKCLFFSLCPLCLCGK